MTQDAAEYGFSRRHLHRLLARYRSEGLAALEPRSRRPRTNPAETSETVREQIIALRGQLGAQGLDAGPVTIAWHLERAGLRAHEPITGEVVVAVFLDAIEQQGAPASTLLSVHRIEPDKTYWRNQNKDPGRWPGSRQT